MGRPRREMRAALSLVKKSLFLWIGFSFMKKKLLTLVFAVLACAVPLPLRAQWSGVVDLSGGMGGMEGNEITESGPMLHGLVKGAFQLNYKKEKFQWAMKVDGKWEPKTTDNGRFSYKSERLGLVYKSVTTSPLSVSAKSDFLWKPSPDRSYSAWILYKYSNDRASNHSVNIGGSVEEVDKFSYYYELPEMNEHKMETGFRTSRSFRDGRYTLRSFLSFQAVGSEKLNTWIVFKSDPGEGGTAVKIEDLPGYAWKYRITPSSTDFDLNGDIHLQVHPLDGEVDLKYAGGLRFSSNHSIDINSGATFIPKSPDGEEGYWRDSLRLRESFNYFSFKADPYLTADVRWKSPEAHADYACQIYGRRLNDEEHRQPLRIKGVYPVGKANIKWTISPHHALNLSNKMSVKHPDYLKVCWYDRTAGYLDQLYRGNEELFSPVTREYALEYAFNWGRFLASTAVSYTRVNNEVDQTWDNEEIEGRQYKVFRWVNSSDSHGIGIIQKLGWQGKIITANAGFTYKQTQRTARNGGAVKPSFDWRLDTEIFANLGKGWRVGIDTKYRSKVATFFTTSNENCELNAHVQKSFKRFTLYLDGRNLLDQPRETSFYSEEQKEFWVEEVRSNRRLVVMGFKWSF